MLVAAPRGRASSPHFDVDVLIEGLSIGWRSETAAMEEVTSIWSGYGVDVRRVRHADGGRSGAFRLAVVIAERPGRDASAGALGSIRFVDNAPEPVIVMYRSAVATLVSSAALMDRGLQGWPADVQELMVGRAFGRALAHEIGHFLLRSKGHAPAGLMRARHEVADLIGPRRTAFLLSGRQVDRLVTARPAGASEIARATHPSSDR